MMRDEISKLILDIGGAMKDFSRGRISLSDAEAAYARLAGEYGRIEGELRNDDATGLLEGILYHHNIRNFSTHSGIYLERKGTVTPLVFLGDGIYAVYAFLNGELTARFAAKAVLVAGMAALVFAYYRDELND